MRGAKGGRWSRLKTTLTVSINLRFSNRALLSLMSLLPNQTLIWSRIRCSFLICVLRSVSSLSFWVALDAWLSLSNVDSKVSTPVATAFSVRSISAKGQHHPRVASS